jgi:hypothetical protein
MEQDTSQLRLECPHCQGCPTVEEWNNALGQRDEPIPLNITSDEWDSYAYDHSGRIDCPECGEVVIYEDMTPV